MLFLSEIGILGYPLLFMSIISLSIILYKIYFYIRLKKISNCPDLKKAISIVKLNQNKSKNIRDELATYILLEIENKYEFGIKTLKIIATTSPMVGLLGTIIGIIKVFKKIALLEEPVSPSLISEGLWNAMLTTSVGLSISLPSLIASFIFIKIGEKRINNYQKQLNKLSFSFEGVIV